MYQELINIIKPKPIFNLRWYNGSDSYSDGDIEDIIIQLIAGNKPEDYIDAIYNNFHWATYYHLTRTRRNILNWYPFNKDADVLEIGCGLGAITGLLCDNCKSVTAVELSKRRATAALLRCREKDNLEIIVGNLNDIEFNKKYDYITLIGVFEYQGSYTDTNDPYADFLKKIKGLLKPGGKLLIAIENQYGLKYWCGAREDHTQIPFDGINQYHNSNRGVRTFSRNELEQLIKRSGFSNTYFYYPMPDYKLPTVIYSQDYLPTNSCMENVKFYYAPDNTTLVANEADIYHDIIDNNVFEFFANSFLVECTDSDDYGKISFAKLCSERFPEYQLGTRFNTQNNIVEKFPLCNDIGKNHISQLAANELALRSRGLNTLGSTIKDNILVSGFSDKPLLENCLFDAYKSGNISEVYSLLDRLLTEILTSSEEAAWDSNIMYQFNPGLVKSKDKYGTILKTGYLDMIFRNCFYSDDTFYWFDQEWTLENTPALFVFYRAISSFYTDYPEAANYIPLEQIKKQYNITETWQDFCNLEGLFSYAVLDKKYIQEKASFR